MNRMSNALLAGDIEEALLTVRRESYEEGYNAGRSVLILKDISTPLTHADKRSEHHDDEIHNNAVGNHARKLSTHARAQKGRAGFFAHRHARDASRAAAHHHKEMARFAHGLGDKDRAHRHEGAAQNHEANAEYHEKRRQDHKTERKKKGLLSRILRKGIDPSSQEEIELLVKAWEEIKHPRGQPENAGQFGSGGGGTKEEEKDHNELSPQEDYKQNGTKAKAFKEWFGDSKVVDSVGDPQETHKVKEVYHGTNVDFNSFKKPSFGGNAAGTGFYFSEHEDIAKQYAKTDKGRVIKAYLSIKKPFNFDEDATADEVAELIKAAKITAGHDDLVGWEEYCITALDTLEGWYKKATDGKSESLSKHALWDILAEGFTKDLANDILAGAGYDGLTHISRDVEGTPRYRDEKSSKNTGRIWVAFKPVQIKSVDNEGTFDPKNPVITKAINTAKRRKDWISEKIAIIMKDGIKGHHVSQAQAVAVAHRLWEKKRNRRLPPAEAKSMDVEIVWVSLGGIVVAPDKIQFKETDGAADGLNEERRNEEHNKEFDPLKVPPIGVWHNPQDHQIYVVDGHKRVAEAKKRGLPTLRAFFIDAESFEDAKKKGEKLNERMGTKSIDDDIEDALNIKAKDAKGHEHAPKGSSKGGQFVSTGGAGGTTKEKGQKITEKTLAKKTMTQKVAPLAQRIKDAVKWQKQNHEEHKEVYAQSHTKVLASVRERHASTGLLDTTKATPGFPSGYDSGRERPESKENYVNENQYQLIRQKAMTKITQMHPAQYPTTEEIKDNLKKIADYGGNVNEARRTLTGNNGDRRQRKIALAEQFGNGKKCGCVYCGLKISFSPKFAEDHIEEDKIVDTKAGGRYRVYNILPACGFCNSSRGNKDAIATLQSSKYMKGPSAS